MTRRWLALGLLLGGVVQARAQQHQHAPSPYAGLEGRNIKALSDSQIRQMQNGEGMSLALAAELNHYPGPRHVLEMAKQLDLSKKQAREIRAVEQAMRAKAKELGAMIVVKERQLDRAFAGRTMDEGSLRSLTGEIAQLEGDLRYIHLAAHLEVRRVLTEKQVRAYDQMRGYK